MPRISSSTEIKVLRTCVRFGDGDLISREEMALKRDLVAHGTSEVPKGVNFKQAFKLEIFVMQEMVHIESS